MNFTQVIEGGKIKGIKLDFKSIGAANASLYVLQDFKDSLPFPVWLNADVLRGPNSVTTPVNATAFLEIVQTMFPDVTISPGWTTSIRSILYRNVDQAGSTAQNVIDTFRSNIQSNLTYFNDTGPPPSTGKTTYVHFNIFG